MRNFEKISIVLFTLYLLILVVGYFVFISVLISKPNISKVEMTVIQKTQKQGSDVKK